MGVACPLSIYMSLLLHIKQKIVKFTPVLPPVPLVSLQIGFKQSQYTVSESDGSVSVTVSVLVGEITLPMPIILSVITADGTATGK